MWGVTAGDTACDWQRTTAGVRSCSLGTTRAAFLVLITCQVAEGHLKLTARTLPRACGCRACASVPQLLRAGRRSAHYALCHHASSTTVGACLQGCWVAAVIGTAALSDELPKLHKTGGIAAVAFDAASAVQRVVLVPVAGT